MLKLIVVYVFGGLTFLPLVLLLLVGYTFLTSEKVSSQTISRKVSQRTEDGNDPKDKTKLKELEKLKVHLTARRTFEPTPVDPNASYVNSLRSLLASNTPGAKQKEAAWLALKGTIVYLYEDEKCTEVIDVIDLTHWDVRIFPSDGLMEGELFAKRNAIMLSPVVVPSATASEEQIAQEEPYYLFIPSLSTMETTYHALLHASSPSLPESIDKIFDSSHVSSFISILDSTSDPLPTRWLNALIGRMFFSYYRTAALERGILSKINKKLSKIKRPSWLTSLHVPHIDVGTSPPMISKPMLKNLTAAGEASVEMALSYNGELRIMVEATATFSLPGSTRKYDVKLVLAVVLHSIQGNILLLVRPPPSNRFWYAFTSSPEMKLSVEPVVSDRQIKWGLVLGTIESRLREVILESIVLPNMDDIPFFKSDAEGLDFKRRGGLWGDAVRVDKTEAADAGDVLVKDSDLEKAVHSGASSSKIPILADGESNASSTSLASASSTSTTKKRNWFGSGGNMSDVFGTSPSGRSTPADVAEDDDDNTLPGGFSPSSSTAKSKSTPDLVHPTPSPQSSIESVGTGSSEASDNVKEGASDAAKAEIIRSRSVPPPVGDGGDGLETPRAEVRKDLTDAPRIEEPSPDPQSQPRGRATSISSAASSSASHSTRDSSPGPSFLGSEGEPDQETQSNTRLNSSSFAWSSLKNRNLLKEINTREGREMLGAQAMGVVKKWGWKGKGANAGGSATSDERPRRDSSASAATVTSEEEVDGEEQNGRQVPKRPPATNGRESYASMRERTSSSPSPFWSGASAQSSVTSAASSSAGYLDPRSSDSDHDRRKSLPPPASLEHSRDRSPSPYPQFLGYSHLPVPPSGPMPVPSQPIHRSQPSISQIPRMTIPGIPASRRGDVMSLSSAMDTATADSSSPPKMTTPVSGLPIPSGPGVPPPLPPRKAKSETPSVIPQPPVEGSVPAPIQGADDQHHDGMDTAINADHEVVSVPSTPVAIEPVK